MTTDPVFFHDTQYLDLINDVLENGILKPNRTGVDTIAVFSRQLRFQLRGGSIPLLTTKKMHTRSIIHEILWYLQGGDNIQYLNDNDVTIWDEWADENGNLGPVYGYQWRKWPHSPEACTSGAIKWQHKDQIADVIHKLRTNPNDRRLIVSAWNVGQIDDMALPPCHYAFQFFVGNGRLSCKVNQRSCDVGLGVPFNIVQYSILTHMIAHVTDLEPGELVWDGGDVHIYENHVDQLKEQTTRNAYPSPKLKFARKVYEIDDFVYEDFKIVDYQHHPLIKMEVAV